MGLVPQPYSKEMTFVFKFQWLVAAVAMVATSLLPSVSHGEDTPVTMVISSSKSIFKQGEDVPIDVTYTNTSSKRIPWLAYDDAVYQGVVVYRKDGTKVPLTDTERRKLETIRSEGWVSSGGGEGIGPLEPGQPSTYSANINEFYKMLAPGDYILRVDGYPDGGPKVSSNMIEIAITK